MYHTNEIILKDTGDAENLVEGGYDSIYQIISCDVDEEKGTLEYENRSFPSVPNFTGKSPSPEYLATIPTPGKIHQHHVRSMKTLRSSEIEEIQDRGVKITIIHDTLSIDR